MALIPLFTNHNQAISYPIHPNYIVDDFEAGCIGVLERANGIVSVRPAVASDNQYAVLGIIDDSKELPALFGDVTTKDLTALNIGVAVGPHTALASNQISLWTMSGIYATDNYGTSVAPSLPSASYLTKVGTALTKKIIKINIEPAIVL